MTITIIMKKILLSILLVLSLSRASAYEVDSAQKVQNTLITHAHLAINKEKRRLELTFRDKIITSNIGIKKSAIRQAKEANDASGSKITLQIKNLPDGTTGIEILAIASYSGELDSFRATSELLRVFQKNQERRNFYDSFLRTYDIPETYNIPGLPFYPQAPLLDKANWRINEESCEEAALLLNYYITNHITFDPEKMNADILSMNDFEVASGISQDKYSERYNTYFLRDLTDPYEMYDLLGKKYLKYPDEKILMVKNPSFEEIQTFVRNNVILTIPMKYTKVLRNKYIRAGKTFHILNIVGYTPDSFITLDPGTKNGRYLAYPKELLYRSMQENGNYFIAIKKITQSKD